MKNAVSFLSNKYSSMLESKGGYTLNNCFFGYSYYFNMDIFIKIYNNYNRYFIEKTILLNSNDSKMLDYLQINKFYAIVFKYEDYTDLSTLDKVVSYKSGKLLAKYHQENFNLVSKIKNIRNEDNLFSNIKEYLEKLNSLPNYLLLKKIDKQLFFEHDKVIKEYKLTKTVVLHGDFGLRNLKILNSKLVLIDFESSRTGIKYRDIIKYFAIDCDSEVLQKAFIDGYNEISSLEKISPLLLNVLKFYTALEIYNFTLRVNNLEFKEVALKLVTSVKEYLDNNFLNK